MDLINDIKEQCDKLAEKQSWVEDEFGGLLNQINEKVDFEPVNGFRNLYDYFGGCNVASDNQGDSRRVLNPLFLAP